MNRRDSGVYRAGVAVKGRCARCRGRLMPGQVLATVLEGAVSTTLHGLVRGGACVTEVGPYLRVVDDVTGRLVASATHDTASLVARLGQRPVGARWCVEELAPYSGWGRASAEAQRRLRALARIQLGVHEKPEDPARREARQRARGAAEELAGELRVRAREASSKARPSSLERGAPAPEPPTQAEVVSPALPTPQESVVSDVQTPQRDGSKEAIPPRVTPLGVWRRTTVARVPAGSLVSFAAVGAGKAKLDGGAATLSAGHGMRGHTACWLLVEPASTPDAQEASVMPKPTLTAVPEPDAPTDEAPVVADESPAEAEAPAEAPARKPRPDNAKRDKAIVAAFKKHGDVAKAREALLKSYPGLSRSTIRRVLKAAELYEPAGSVGTGLVITPEIQAAIAAFEKATGETVIRVGRALRRDARKAAQA